VAVPPATRAGIAFDPALPPEYEKLAQHWPQGNLSRRIRLRRRRFGARTAARVKRCPEGTGVHHVRPSARATRVGHPVGLHGCAYVRSAASEQRREQALEGFVTLFGDAASRPDRLCRSLLGHRGIRAWRTDGRGPPGSWTTYGPCCAGLSDGIFWAGTKPPTSDWFSSTARCGSGQAMPPQRCTGRCPGDAGPTTPQVGG